MLYLDVLRGEDSTGVAAISNAWGKIVPTVEVFKSLGPPTDFFLDHAVGTRTRNVTHKPVDVFMGHNRAATQGKVTAENAHPFEFDNLVGAHNGTVGQSSLKDFHGFKDYDIDSQIIFSHLSHTQNIEDVWKDADGAMALVWWDKVANRLNIIRNQQRPMQFAYSEDGKLMMYASENWMLVVAAMRHGIKLQKSVAVKPDCQYSFEVGDEGKVVHTERNVAPFVAKPVVYGYGAGHNWSRGWEDSDWGYPKTPVRSSFKSLVVKEFIDTPGNPSAIAFTEEGELVRIVIPPTQQKAIKTKMLARKIGEGYYVTDGIYRSGVNPQQFWCNFNSLSYVHLKGKGHILKREANCFEIVYDTEAKKVPLLIEKDKEDKDLAPWYTDERRLTKSAYESIVKCGCTNCLVAPDWEEKDELHWLGVDEFICGKCKEIPFVIDLINEHKGEEA